jgi:glycosyltransferase involved in cell wall biosynthesis
MNSNIKKQSAKVRIALALEYPLLQHGGVETLVRALITGLSPQFEIVLVSGDRDRKDLGSSFASLVSAHFFWDMEAPSVAAAKKLAENLIQERIKMAHFHSGGIYGWQSHKAHQSPIYALARTDVPCLVTCHLVTPFTDFCRPDRSKLEKALLLPKAWLNKARLLSSVDSEILVSKADQARMRRWFPPFATKLRQMYHSKLTRSNGTPPQDQRKKTVLCLGTFCERKGQAILVRAFGSIARQYPDWTLQLMGRSSPSPYMDEINAAVVRLGLSGQVLILPPQSDPTPVLEETSVFAMPSLAEALGLSLQEALYHGCACVGSDVGGIPELIEHEVSGLLVSPKDEIALAAALDRLMSDFDLRARFARQGREAIIEKGMLVEVMIKNHVGLYETTLAGEKMQ